ncbi:MAG: WbqC family protein [Flavobacteriaceae bacterium]|nr:WbqC family protein [Flavobacteriaceae bacterium]
MLFLPTYFAPISQYVAIFKNKEIVFEVEDNFQKQTYRNRCNIYGANGKLTLNIPIIHNGKQKTKDVKIDNSSLWQKQHLKSLESAYYSSPFFEFYMDDLFPLYEQKSAFLLDFNLKCHEFIMNALQSEITYSKTDIYEVSPKIKDCRNLAIAKHEKNYNLNSYFQVFNDKHGFMPNLSVLDLLFMEGTNSEIYLKNQKIIF